MKINSAFKLIFFSSLLLVSIVTISSIAVYFSLQSLPDVMKAKGCIKTSIHQIELCSNNPDYLNLDEISPTFINALIISEDASFYAHKGFDWDEIKKSIDTNIKRGKFARGGSTITQQTVKNIFLSSDKSLLRKFKEAYLAKEFEKRFSKKEILEKYVNLIEFGPNIYGIKKAAQYYFDKSASQINLLESAFLVFLMPNPKIYGESFLKGELTDFAKDRIETICRKMKLFKRINEDTYNFAVNHIDQFPWRELIFPFSDDISDGELLQEMLNEGGVAVSESEDDKNPSLDTSTDHDLNDGEVDGVQDESSEQTDKSTDSDSEESSEADGSEEGDADPEDEPIDPSL